MSKLLGEAEQRQSRLKRAGDAQVDPADLGAREPAGGTAGQKDSKSASISASEKAVDSAGLDASDSASTTAGANAGDDADANASTPAPARTSASKSVRPAAAGKAGQKTSGKAGGKASKSASGKAGRNDRRRRLGRPRGPERVATTVRLLTDLDEGLTDACTEIGVGPQEVLDAALAEWLIARGFFDAKTLPPAVDAVVKRVSESH